MTFWMTQMYLTSKANAVGGLATSSTKRARIFLCLFTAPLLADKNSEHKQRLTKEMHHETAKYFSLINKSPFK